MNTKQTYKEKLLDPRWQKKRLQILERDDWQCQMCSYDKDTLHVHHKRYIWGNDPWDVPDDCLITLCAGCHENESVAKDALDDLRAIAAVRLSSGEITQLSALLLNRPLKYWGRDDIDGLHPITFCNKRDFKDVLLAHNFWGLH